MGGRTSVPADRERPGQSHLASLIADFDTGLGTLAGRSNAAEPVTGPKVSLDYYKLAYYMRDRS
jgi:hypothetical protein